MGIESRDYYRDDSPGGGGFGGSAGLWPPVCKWLLIANIIVFLLQIFVTRPMTVEDIDALYRDELPEFRPTAEQIDSILARRPQISVFQEAFELRTDAALGGQIWRLITTAFCHDRNSLFHILFNMLFLIWFGRALERMYGSREFLSFYLLAAVAASVAYILLELVTGTRFPVIGASGSIMAVLMLYAMHFPREQILLFLVVPIQVRFIVLFYVIFDLHPVLLALAGDNVGDGVAHAAHLGGLAFGYIYYSSGMRVGHLLGKGGQKKKRKRPRQAPKLALKTAPPKSRQPDALEGKVDEILQKISDHGSDSLTDEERKFLEFASEQYRGREDK